MRKLMCLLAFAGLTACGDGGRSSVLGPQAGTDACNTDGQKTFVLENLYDWYLWNDLLPANINIDNYASAEELVTRVTRDFGPQNANNEPLDLFSSVGSLQADTEFFGEGKFEGFGFSWRFVDQAQTDFRIVRTFVGSPADLGGLARGQQVISLNTRTVADIASNEGISAFFGANTTVDFEIQPLVGGVFNTSVTEDIVTIDPIPQSRIIDAGNGRNVGYFELSTFISTADPEFETVFAEFNNANVNQVIIDLRYNGGGLVSTANLLGDFLGGLVAQNLVFSSTEFNADRAAENNSTDFFGLRGNSISLSQLVIIASRGTASASELVTNGMIPHVDVTIVGDRTFGKPVGQIGIQFCEKILRPTSFKLANADGAGDYFDGLPVDCAVTDDLNFAVGDDLDPNMIAALTYLATGACPAVPAPIPEFLSTQDSEFADQEQNRPPHREFLDAY